jgi:nucleotide-binding universal stress UspA family protein
MFKRILIAIDLDAPGSWPKALATAVDLARTGGAHLTLATVITERDAISDPWSPAGHRERVEVAKAKLASLGDSCGDQPHSVRVRSGPPSSGIIELAGEAEADLIVLASHRPGLRDYLIGGNAAHVVRHAPCSVLVVRE